MSGVVVVETCQYDSSSPGNVIRSIRTLLFLDILKTDVDL